MKNILLKLIISLLLTSCNNRQVDNNVAVNKQDTVKIDTSLYKVNRIFNNPFRDINNFEIMFGDNFIDSLHTTYSNKGQIDVILTKDICLGDNCESYKTIVDKSSNKVLYLFKGDGGEYGFSNDQYFLSKDSLTYVRNFSVNIETWPTDSTETEWKIEELVYCFENKKQYSRSRTSFTKNLDEFDFTLKNVKTKNIEIDFTKTYQDKSVELKKLLEMKNLEDGD
jgi:hypothetical protein